MTLTIINVMVSSLAVIMMALVLRGTLFHFLARVGEARLKPLSDFRAGDWMRLGVGIYHVKGVVRIARWDVYGPLSAWLTDPEYVRSTQAALWNIGFSTASIVGSICVLYALWRNIPANERRGYTLLTSPWWPGKPPFFYRELP